MAGGAGRALGYYAGHMKLEEPARPYDEPEYRRAPADRPTVVSMGS